MANVSSSRRSSGRTTASRSTRSTRRMRPYAGSWSFSNNHSHRDWVVRRAQRILNRKRNNKLDFSQITGELNTKFYTAYSVFQVAAALGRAGYRNGQIGC